MNFSPEATVKHSRVAHRIDSADVDARTDAAMATDASQIQKLQWQVEATAAIAELMTRIATSRTTASAHMEIVQSLCEFLGAEAVAIGVPHDGTARVQVVGVSDIARVDPTADGTLLFAETMSEAILREQFLHQPATYSRQTESAELMMLAHERLRRETGACSVLSSPLVDRAGEVVAVWTASFASVPANETELQAFANASRGPIAEALQLATLACESTPARWKRGVRSVHGRRAAMVGFAVAAALMVALLMPIPHRVSCAATLQPIGQRYAVAPNDGILKESFARTGDFVKSGQTLAVMDTTDLELQLADVIAQRERARKRKDVQQAQGNATEIQLAELEVRELAAQIDLLQHRITHRSIVSDIDGIVLMSELNEDRGVPVRTGDVLMLVSPLSRLRAEVEIAEADVAYVQAGHPVQFIADGNPLDPIVANVDRIRPVSEIRSGQNVFVAEVVVDNTDGRLRPGMQASTKVAAGYRAAGWVLFHHAVERLYRSVR